jgi:hypothetical protein
MGIVGNLYSELGRLADGPDSGAYLERALWYYERTLNIARALGDRASEAELLRAMAHAQRLLLTGDLGVNESG